MLTAQQEEAAWTSLSLTAAMTFLQYALHVTTINATCVR
jgi:hypothetical protein